MCSRTVPPVLLLIVAVGLSAGQVGAETTGAALQALEYSSSLQTQPAAVSLVDKLRQASDPSTAISLYAEAAREEVDDLAVQSAFVRRMIEFGMPALAERQAGDIVARDPNDGVAWAVLADAAGRRLETANALAHAATAAQLAPDDPFVQQTAGKLLAWFDTQADASRITDEMNSAARFIRSALGVRNVFKDAYQQAVAFYREQDRMRRSAERGVSPESQQELYAQEQPRQQAEQSPESTDYDTYDSYNTYYTTPEYRTYAYATPYDYGYASPYYYGGYGYPYYYDDYSPYYSGYYAPAFYYGGYTWPYYSPVIVAPSFWPRHHKKFFGFFGHDSHYPRYHSGYGGRYGSFGFHGPGYDRSGYGRRDDVDRSRGGFRSSLDRHTSPSIPRGVAQDWARGRPASPSIPRGTFDRGSTVGRSRTPSASIPRGTFSRGTTSGRTGTSSLSTPRSVTRQGGSTNYGYVSPSMPRSATTIRPSPGISGRAPSSITRSTTPRSSSGTRRIAPSRGFSTPRSISPSRSFSGRSISPSRSFSAPRSVGPSRSFTAPRSSGFSRGFSGSRAPRSFSAAPRASGRMSSPSIARGGFSRGGAGGGRR